MKIYAATYLGLFYKVKGHILSSLANLNYSRFFGCKDTVHTEIIFHDYLLNYCFEKEQMSSYASQEKC